MIELGNDLVELVWDMTKPRYIRQKEILPEDSPGLYGSFVYPTLVEFEKIRNTTDDAERERLSEAASENIRKMLTGPNSFPPLVCSYGLKYPGVLEEIARGAPARDKLLTFADYALTLHDMTPSPVLVDKYEDRKVFMANQNLAHFKYYLIDMIYDILEKGFGKEDSKQFFPKELIPAYMKLVEERLPESYSWHFHYIK